MRFYLYSKFIAFFVFFAATVFIPLFSFNIDISTYLTVVSIIFTILVGFFIAAATTNYLRLQTLISQEDATLISIFKLCKIIQPSSKEKIVKEIDAYAIAALNYKIKDYVKRTEIEFGKLAEMVDSIEPVDERGTSLYPTLQEEINQAMETRQETALASQVIVSPDHWVVLILLALVLNILILSLRTGDLIANVLLAILMTAAYLLLLLLHEVDTNRFLEEKISYGGTQRVFDALGTLKYYPEEAIKKKLVSMPKESYRIGVITSSQEREIKVLG